MSMAKLHPSLPAPVVHSSHLPTSQSKSHVLAGVQDAYWSDDEAEDADCPLCMEEMDVSDLNFKPCPCGYQICRFCWHHIKENLNGRCPACRREYTDDAVQFKPINKEDHKRLTQQRKQRDRERKDLDALGRRNLLNVRVVQRNVVYVVGLGSRFAKEEMIPILRSSEYFGQYGKITKILLVKRTPPGARSPVVGLYITYYRREDAARAITSVDGAPSPSGGGDVMRASYGTTKYCIAFLRNVTCTNNGCLDLHDWGDEKDCFTKEDLSTLKHTMKDSENRPRTSAKQQGDGGLPRTAGWAQKPSLATSSVTNTVTTSSSSGGRDRTRRGHKPTRSNGETRESRTQTSAARQQATDKERDRRPASTTKTPSQASSSRPTTPAVPSLPPRPSTPVRQKVKKESQSYPAVPLPPRSPTSSITVDSDFGSQDAVSASPALSPPTTEATPVTPALPPGLPTAPPGLQTTPPGISAPSIAPSASYQMSTQAQALLDDMRNRRESVILKSSTSFSPFPDLDKTLQILAGSDGDTGGFNFNLDPKLAVDDDQFETSLLDLEDATSGLSIGPTGVYPAFDPFSNAPRLTNSGGFNAQFGPPPGLFHTNSSKSFAPSFAPGLNRAHSSSSAYTGSFSPFAESADSASPSLIQRFAVPGPDEEPTRRISRMGFAQPRQSSGLSATSSPLMSAASSVGESQPQSAVSAHAPWQFQRHLDLGPPPGLPMRTNTPGSHRASPLVPYATAMPQTSFMPQPSRFQPFDMGQPEMSLKDMLGIGRNSNNASRTVMQTNDDQQGFRPSSSMPFHDPAIMTSVPYVSPSAETFDSFSPHMQHVTGSPGLSFQHSQDSFHSFQSPAMNHMAPVMMHNTMANPVMTSAMQNPSVPAPIPPVTSVPEPSPEASPMLSAADFPALPTASADSHTRPGQSSQHQVAVPKVNDEATQAKLERKAAKKAAAAERAAERDRVAKEKAADRERIAKEKAEAKEKAAREKAEEKERIAKQKAEERERLLKEESERKKALEAERVEKERLAQQKKADVEQAPKEATAGLKGNRQGKGKASPDVSSQNARNTAPMKATTTITTNTVSASPSPILSKMPKKNKPATRPIKIPKEEEVAQDTLSSLPSATTGNSETPQLPSTKLPNVSEVVESAAAEMGDVRRESNNETNDGVPSLNPKSITQLLREIEAEKGRYYVESHPFFDFTKVNPTPKLPLDYNTMARALSAFPAGGGSLASGALNDQTVTSFQQLLETLTQTMSELVQLLPQTAWGSIFDVLSQDLKDLKREYSLHSNSTSFDGLVHDDLPEDADDEDDDDIDEDDFDISPPQTPTMDKRAKWMEIQLAKLEELHREVNTAAVRTILATNDRGRDRKGILPYVGNTLARFEHLGLVDEEGVLRRMSTDELEKKLVVAKEAAVFAETELREAMEAMQALKP